MKGSNLFAAAKRTCTTEAWAAYRNARNCLKSQIRRAKKRFVLNMSKDLSDTRRGSYQWWCKAKKACSLCKSHPPMPDIVLDGKIAQSDEAKANLLASAFATSFRPSTKSNTTKPASCASKFSIESVTGEAVFHNLRYLKSHRSTLGFVTNQMLKETASHNPVPNSTV